MVPKDFAKYKTHRPEMHWEFEKWSLKILPNIEYIELKCIEILNNTRSLKMLAKYKTHEPENSLRVWTNTWDLKILVASIFIKQILSTSAEQIKTNHEKIKC